MVVLDLRDFAEGAYRRWPICLRARGRHGAHGRTVGQAVVKAAADVYVLSSRTSPQGCSDPGNRGITCRAGASFHRLWHYEGLDERFTRRFGYGSLPS
jgi:hypothetical protein